MLLYGASRLTEAERTALRARAVSLCIDRNLTYFEMSKCIVVHGFREMWVLRPGEYPERII